MSDFIKIIGAKEHNLKNINLDIPKNRFVVFVGLSGSGKSSLVFDTIYAEAQRQLLETFSAYARKRLPTIRKSNVQQIKYISTTIVIDQKRLSSTSRSTVGTITEIYNYLRLLYGRVGRPFAGYSNAFSFNKAEGMCPACKGIGKEMAIDLDLLIDWNKSISEGAVLHPLYKPGSWFTRHLEGSDLFDIKKPIKDFSEEEKEKFLYSEKFKVENHVANGLYTVTFEGVVTGIKRRFKENSKYSDLDFFIYQDCHVCNGTRLNKKALQSLINGKNIAQLCAMELTDLKRFITTISVPKAEDIITPIIEEIKLRLDQLIGIGAGYLSLAQSSASLSGGEAQRLKIVKQLNCDLMNMIYILDEPSMGLHPRDIYHLINILRQFCDKGNSVLVVDHEPSIIEAADYVIELGPGAGSFGGEVVFQGTVNELKQSSTLTGKTLTAKQSNTIIRKKPSHWLTIKNASIHNLKNLTVNIPIGLFTCVTGVAGSGKSSLIIDCFARKQRDVIIIDQSPIGKSSRSNPLSYIGIFDEVRNVLANATGMDPAFFSYNSKGACPYCNGLGYLEVDMHFLDPVKMTCPKCSGKKFKSKVLKLKYKEKNINDILNMTIIDAQEFFENKKIINKLQLLDSLGLGYLTLGQPLSTVSGGEAQRLKIVSELHKKGNIYIMDEPTVGLHVFDVKKIIKIFKSLVNEGNTLIIIEHNLDVIKHADWIIDLGPESGFQGGKLVAEGPPENIINCKESYTGGYLKEVMKVKT